MPEAVSLRRSEAEARAPFPLLPLWPCPFVPLLPFSGLVDLVMESKGGFGKGKMTSQ